MDQAGSVRRIGDVTSDEVFDNATSGIAYPRFLPNGLPRQESLGA